MKMIVPALIDDTSMVSSSVPENDFPEYNIGTTYALGAKCIKASTHRIYESLQEGNLNHDPAAPGSLYWSDVAPTNRWAMFDDKVGSFTTQATEVTFVIAPAGIPNAIALLDLLAATVRVRVHAPDAGYIYDKTTSVASAVGINDWAAYYRTPVRRRTGLILTDLPYYTGTTIEVTLSAPAGIASLGTFVLGASSELGATSYGLSAGISDYSVKTRDAFGNYFFVERAFSKKARFSFEVANDMVDPVHAVLSKYRAKPIVYMGHEDYQCTVIYGIFKDFDITIPYPTYSLCNLEIEGLT